MSLHGWIPVSWQPDLRERAGWGVLLVAVSLAAGVVALRTDDPIAIAGLLGAVPILLALLVMVHNLFLGVVLYLVCEYLQPGFRLHALGQLHPTFAVAGGFLFAYVLNVLAKRAPLSIHNWQVKGFAVFLLIVAASAYNAISVPRVFYAGMDIFKTACIFFVFIQVIDRVVRLKRLIWTYVVIHFLLAMIGVAIFVTGSTRHFGDVGGSFLGDENDSAMALLIMLPYVYFMLQITRRRAVKIFLVLAMLAGATSVLFSFSRGAFVGFIATVGYLWIKSTKKVAAAAGLTAFVILFLAVMPQTYWQRIESIRGYKTEGSAQGRLDAWEGALEMLHDHPLVGVGADNFNRTFGELYNRNSARWTAAHSLYFQTIGELGLAGAAFLLWFLTRNLIELARLRRRLRGRSPGTPPHELYLLTLAVECGLVSYLVTTIFLNSLFYPHLWHFAAVTAIATNCVRRLEQEGVLERPRAELKALSGQGGQDSLDPKRLPRRAAGMTAD